MIKTDHSNIREHALIVKNVMKRGLKMPNRWIMMTEREQNEVLLDNNGDYPKSLIKKIRAAQKTISISSRKGKGRGLQMWVCKKISKLIGIRFDNQDDQCLIHCREMGQSGTDVILRGIAQEEFPFSIECKNTESFNLVNTIEQVKNNVAKNTEWMIIHKRKAFPNPIVIID